jgi:hypothetical protein
MVDLTDVGASILTALIFIIPLIPIAVIWFFLHPSGFWQTLAMLFVSILLYPIFFFIEIIAIDVMK